MYYKVKLPKEFYGGITKYCATEKEAQKYTEEHIPSEVWHKVEVTKINYPRCWMPEEIYN